MQFTPQQIVVLERLTKEHALPHDTKDGGVWKFADGTKLNSNVVANLWRMRNSIGKRLIDHNGQFLYITPAGADALEDIGIKVSRDNTQEDVLS